jgi:glutathione S-transferase
MVSHMDNHSLVLFYHPLASFCHKVLIALYENEVPFEGRIVDLASAASSEEMLSFWPVGKIPVLRDRTRVQTVPETSIIIEYLSQHYPGGVALIPEDRDDALQARLWDRFFDLYVSAPIQKIVADRLRSELARDQSGVSEARATLTRAYALLEVQLQSRRWAIGEAFTMADCAAAPALFYAEIVQPFSNAHRNVTAYYERLMARTSVARTIAEARPYFAMFPLREQIPARFTEAT